MRQRPSVTGLEVHDIRFPTSEQLDGSDAMNPDPDYSAAYVVLRTDAGEGEPAEGHGFVFTIGRGNDVTAAAIRSLRPHVVGRPAPLTPAGLIAMFDFVAVSGSWEDRVIEYVDHLHGHFADPAVVESGRYRAPTAPGFSARMYPESIAAYRYPDGPAWRARVARSASARSALACAESAGPGQARPESAHPGRARPESGRPAPARPGQAHPGRARPESARSRTGAPRIGAPRTGAPRTSTARTGTARIGGPRTGTARTSAFRWATGRTTGGEPVTTGDFEGLAALVTGGASGIGAAIAATLRDRGARVAVLDRDPSGAPDGTLPLHADVTSDEAVRAGVEAAVAEFGALHTVVGNAGVGAIGSVEDNSDQEWHRLLDINVLGLVRTARAALPHLRAAAADRPGAVSITHTCSIAATAGLPQRAAYSASKGAVLSLTLAMAADHIREGVRVNCVNPGTVDTPWVGRLLDQAPDPAAERAALAARQPTGRLVSAEEVAAAVAYLASPAAAAVTGTALAVDGGMQGLRLHPAST